MAQPTLATDALREQTSAHHEALDQLPLLSRLMSPDLKLEDYHEILSRMLSCFHQAESAIATQMDEKEIQEWNYESKLPSLQRDCERVCRPPPQAPDLTLESPAEAQGAMYVLMGSSLGGRFIYRNLQHILAVGPETGAAFYASSAHDLPRWNAFRRRLNEMHLGNSASIHEVIQGAIKCFRLFTLSFK